MANKRWVIKIGSSLLTDDGKGLDQVAIQRWTGEIARLVKSGIEVVLVSSGAVAEGMVRMGWSERPQEVHLLQAAAAIGQMGLVQTYESSFQEHGLRTAQILLTHDDLANRQRYLNARSTIRGLLELGVVPVVNENDTVATDEIKLGDNDTLASLVTNLVEADLLVILTDQAGMFDSDPRSNPDAKLIERAPINRPDLLEMAGGGVGTLGRGGMRTKVLAAQRAAMSGTDTVIAAGRLPNVLDKIAAGETVGTVLEAAEEALQGRKLWLAGQLQVRGELTIDAGAVKVLSSGGKSLLPVGVTALDGEFNRGDLVSCLDANGNEVARGLVNYNADELQRIIGICSSEISSVLGYVRDEELIHRDNLVLV